MPKFSSLPKEHNFQLQLTEREQPYFTFTSCREQEDRYFTCPQLFSGSIKKTKENSGAIEKAIQWNLAYNAGLSARENGSKDYVGVEHGGEIFKTREYLITLTPQGAQAVKGMVEQYLLPQLGNPKFLNGLRLDSQTAIRVSIDKRHRIMCLSVDAGEIFFMLLSKDAEVMLDQFELTFQNRSKENQLTVEVSSKGEHSMKSGVFRDELSVSAAASFLQLAKYQVSTRLDKDGKLEVKGAGKICMVPVELTLTGKVENQELWPSFAGELGINLPFAGNRITGISAEFAPAAPPYGNVKDRLEEEEKAVLAQKMIQLFISRWIGGGT